MQWHLQIMVASETTVGDLTTTCLTVVPLGCYQTKSACCKALASRWEQMEIAVGE